MRILKNLIISILTVLLGLCLTGIVASSVLSVTIGQPSKIKSWLTDSKIYPAVTENIYQNIIKNSSQQADSIVKYPEVQAVIKQTITPQFVQQSTEQIIDGSYKWLEGKSPNPDFAIDLTELKNSFAVNSGNAAEKHVLTLPLCTNAQLRQLSNFDLFNIPCRPAGYDLAVAKQLLVNEISNGTDIVANQTITPSTLKTSDNKQPLFDQYKDVPKMYQLLQKLPLVFSILGLVFAIAIVGLHSQKRSGFNRVARSLLTSGIMLIITGFIVRQIINNFKIDKQTFNGTINTNLQTALVNLVKNAAQPSVKIIVIFGIIFTVLGAGILIFLRFHAKPNTPDIAPIPPPTPTIQTPTEPTPIAIPKPH